MLYGVCEEHQWPYDKEKVNVKPSEEAYQKAKRLTITPTKIPVDVKVIRSYLAKSYPVMIAICLLDSAGESVKRNHGLLSVPHVGSTTMHNTGFHAVVIVGYDDNKKYFIVRNSWGDRWVKKTLN